MASKGKRGWGGKAGDAKAWVVRHGHAPKRSPNSAEKAIETQVRRAGKKACQEGLAE